VPEGRCPLSAQAVGFEPPGRVVTAGRKMEGAPMTDAAIETPAEPGASRGRRGIAIAGQVAGVAGIVISILLIVVVLLGRGWVVETANDLATNVNTTIARADPLLDIAGRAVTGVSERMSDLAETADEVATTVNPTPEALVPLQERLATMTDRYLALREGYASLRAEVAAAADRAQTIARLVPFVELPTGPGDTIRSVDERLRELDDRVMSVIEAGGLRGRVDQAAAAIAERARAAETALGAATAALDQVEARLVELQAKVTGVAETVDAAATVVTLILVLLLLYLAFLHWVLFRASRRYGASPTTA
jgi:hypothetical protein